MPPAIPAETDSGHENETDRPGTSANAGPARWYGEYDSAGVDLSLLRYLLQLSPLERLRLMDQHARDSSLLEEYGRRRRETQAGANR